MPLYTPPFCDLSLLLFLISKIMQKMGKNCEICREWQEHCYWSHMADENKHFCKLMVGDFTGCMSIPSRFGKNFIGHISEEVNLKSPSGKSWSIGVASDTDEVALRSGWKEFVSAHSIEEGDCLLFKYSGVSSFDVLVFDSSGCEKTSSHFAQDHGCQMAVVNSAGVEGAQRGNDISDITRYRAPESPPIDHGDAQLLMTLRRDTGRGIVKPCRRDVYHEIEQSHREIKDDLEVDDGDAPAKAVYYFCKNGPVSEFHLTEQDKEEISSVRVPVDPKNPVFVQVMHPSHVRANRPSIVGVSSEFAGKYLGAIGREIILQRASRGGRRWHVRYAVGDQYRGLSGSGWRDFARGNGLLAHDVCLFELVMEEGARRTTATVHVLRRLRGRLVLMRWVHL